LIFFHPALDSRYGRTHTLGLEEMSMTKNRLEGMTPEALEARADAALDKAEESFHRCDSDGFLSQWAHSLNAQEDQVQAKILRNGGRAGFIGLWTKGGRRVKARLIQGAYGWSWLLDHAESGLIAQRGKRDLPTGRRSRILSKLGLVERWEMAPARACVKGSGTGLSGAASCFVGTMRTGDEWGQDAELAPPGEDPLEAPLE
jgi:hypothetical protein